MDRRALGLAMGQLRVDPAVHISTTSVGIAVARLLLRLLLLLLLPVALLDVALPVGLAGMRLRAGAFRRHGLVGDIARKLGTVEDVAAASLRNIVAQILRRMKLGIVIIFVGAVAATATATAVRGGKVPKAGGTAAACGCLGGRRVGRYRFRR